MQPTTWPPSEPKSQPTPVQDLQHTITTLEAMVETLTIQQLEGPPK